ncbi:MAG: DEAD/DEAH box helicase [Akkermansiaceae bacterium]
MVKFDSLGLDPLILKAVTDTGYDTPTPIQAQAIPAVMSGSDVMAAAQTGTGKTAGFTLPLLHKLAPGRPARDRQVRALVLTPTRELAAQVSESVTAYGKHLKLTNAVVFGGVKANPQISKLRRGVDILIATPGRLLDLYQQGAIDFKQLEVLILDEADRMLDMGFIHDIKKIIAALPYKRQNLMFSATFSKDIRQLAKGLINDPIEISVSPRNTTAETVTQWICPVNKTDKAYALADLIEGGDWQQVLVFSRTKHGANKLATFLEKKGIGAAPIHGNKSQNARTRALADFKAGKIRVLVATDIAARGIDIDQLPHVVNFDLPEVPEDYVHRIGRTGRAGSSGEAVSLVAAEELHLLVDVEKLIGRLIERKFLPGHEPSVPLPEAKLGARVPRPKVSRGGGGGGRRGGGGRGQGGGGGGRGGRPQGRSSQGGGGGGGSRRPFSGGGRRSSGGGGGGRSGNR